MASLIGLTLSWPFAAQDQALAQTTGCNIYPIALSTKSLTNASGGTIPVGTLIPDIWNGQQPGNFGWLTWAGSPSDPTLVTSLTPPGNVSTYVNPSNPNDHTLDVGDSVTGKPGVTNSRGVRDALNVLKTMDIVVPVWDTSTGTGSNTTYHIVSFATVRITEYHLPNQNRISAIYKGVAACGGSGPSCPPGYLLGVSDFPPTVPPFPINAPPPPPYYVCID